MDITHPQSLWCQQFIDGHATGPQRLAIDGHALFSFMHCRVDNISDDDLAPSKSHHYRRGGCALFEGRGVFTAGAPIELAQTVRTAANASRVTYDIKWPKATPLKNGFEAGSVVLRGDWLRFFVLRPESTDEPQWREMPRAGEAPISFTPIPAAVVFENSRGERLELGLGDDLWRWTNGLNGEFLHGTGKLEISRSGSNYSLRRWVTICDPAAEAKAAAARDLAARQAAEAAGEDAAVPAPSPVSQPEARQFRFNAYFAWPAPELVPGSRDGANAPLVPVTPAGLPGDVLASLNAAEVPELRIDIAALPLPAAARRTKDSAPCWCSRGAQNLFRRIIRQLRALPQERGTLVLDHFTPGWCDTPAHANRSHAALHWDLSAMLDLAAWTRQQLGDGWTICAPQTGIWAEMPSLQAIGGPSGFRAE